MARRKMTWEELKANGRKPSVWMARQREEAAMQTEARDKKAVAESAGRVREFLQLADRVNNSFANRIDRITYGWRAPNASEAVEQIAILSLCLDGRRFTWPERHPLTFCKNYAIAVATRAIGADAHDQKMCGQFLLELSHGAPGFIFDVAESDLFDKAIMAFGEDGDNPGPLRTIAILSYTAWKDLTGSYRHGDGNNPYAFDPRDVEILDAASDALQKHWHNTGREWKTA